nr:unnamed protein product [Spirometra erinaceieuropaei]
MKTDVAIYGENRIAAATAKRTARKSQEPPTRNITTQPYPTCPRCQRTFRARIGLVGHLQTQCINRLTTAPDSTSTSTTSTPTPTSVTSNPNATLPSPTITSTTFALNTAMTPNTIISTTTANDKNAPGDPTVTYTFTITTATSSDLDSAPSCPHCDRTLTSHIDLVSHWRIHRKETGEPEPGAPAYTRRLAQLPSLTSHIRPPHG